MSVPNRNGSRSRGSRIARASLVIALSAVVFACSRSEEDDAVVVDSRPEHARAKNPPYLLNDDLVERTISALKDLRQEYLRTHPAAEPKDQKAAPKSIAMGVGITRSIERSGEIVKLHGFASKDDFEQTFAHVQRALSAVLMGETRGLDSQSMRHTLVESQQVLTKDLEKTKRDQTLSVTARNTRIEELERSINEYQRNLDELDDVANAIKSEGSSIPEQNIAAVTKQQDELKAVLAPLQIP